MKHLLTSSADKQRQISEKNAYSIAFFQFFSESAAYLCIEIENKTI